MIIVSAIGFIGAGAVVTWSVFSRPTDTYNTHEVADSFNLQRVDAPSRLAAGETLRDAVAAPPPAASSLMRPIAEPGMLVGAAKETERRPPVSPQAEVWARKHPFMADLVAKPAAFLLAHSALRSAQGTRAFLGDAKKVDAYMNSPLVRVVLRSPAMARSLMTNAGVAGAFVSTPAMRDPQTVKALLASPMLHKILDCPAIRDTLADGAVMKTMTSDPRTEAWIAKHPEAMLALGGGR